MPSWKNERLFFFVFLSKAIIDILPPRMYQKKKKNLMVIIMSRGLLEGSQE